MGLANTFSHSEKTRLEVMPRERRSYRYQGEQHLRLPGSLRQVGRSSIISRSKLSSFLSIRGRSRSRLAASISCTSLYAGMNSTERPDCTSRCPMAHSVSLPCAGIPSAR